MSKWNRAAVLSGRGNMARRAAPASPAAGCVYGFLILCFFLASCQTMQKDLLLSTVAEGAAADITELENIIVALDNGAGQNELRAARLKVQEFEDKAVGDNHYQALLAAWSGRLYLLEGKPAEAERRYQQSRSLYPGNIQALILSIRMEGDGEKRLVMINEALAAEAASGELHIELGRTLLELRQFPEAVAAFDTAFTRLGREVYETTYRNDRERAWEFRNLDISISASTERILERPELSWREALSITARETNLLNFITAGRNWNEEELFNRLSAGLFIPPAQAIELAEWPPSGKANINDRLTRSGAAWFLWRLYAELRNDRTLLSRYSTRYRAGGRSSPVQDLPLDSIFFDSVLGCIEREIMALPDGKNFMPSQSIRGAAFYEMLMKIQP